MRILKHAARPDRRSPTLMILLPGAWQQPEDFLGHGFVDALHDRDVDVWLPALAPQDTEAGHALASLEAEVLHAALAAGYRAPWLAGISLGGLLALGTAACDRVPLAGLCLLAPYPGNRLLTREIAAAGGPGRWDAASASPDDDERRVWRWLARRPTLPLYLGFGRDDRFADGLELMAGELPPARVARVDGGHDWPTWQRVWQQMLPMLGDPWP